MEWSRAEAPQQPVPGFDRGPEMQVLDGGFVSPFVRGRAGTTNGIQWWVRGAAYHSDGTLVPQSQRLLLQGRPRPVPVDPEVLSPSDDLDRLPGTWLYVGPWQPHFGHFLGEVLSMLWPLERVEGILCHPNAQSLKPGGETDDRAEPDLPDYQRRVLELAGYGGAPVVMALRRGVRVDRLLVPRRAMVLESWVEPEAVRAWERVATNAGPPAEWDRVYLSRTLFNATPGRQARGVRSSAETDAATDAVFGGAGFHVVSPELLPVEEQIRIARGAAVLAGWSGSALHLSMFAPQSTRVLVLGDVRRRLHPNQQALDAARDRLIGFVPPRTVENDLPEALRELGL